MTHFSPEDARHLQYDLMPGDKATYGDYCLARGIDFTREPLEVEVGERMMGGLICHDDLQSLDVKPLYVSSMMNNFSGCMSIGYAAGLGSARSAAFVSRPSFRDRKPTLCTRPCSPRCTPLRKRRSATRNLKTDSVMSWTITLASCARNERRSTRPSKPCCTIGFSGSVIRIDRETGIPGGNGKTPSSPSDCHLFPASSHSCPCAHFQRNADGMSKHDKGTLLCQACAFSTGSNRTGRSRYTG